MGLLNSRIRTYSFNILIFINILIVISSCSNEDQNIKHRTSYNCEDVDPDNYYEKKLFSKLTHEETGIDYFNVIIDTGKFNIYNNDFIYNGGGVAAADLNNDGLCDLIFSGNQSGVRIFQNLGDFKFKDVTSKAILESTGWFTGLSTADVNGDGLIDIYISKSGYDLVEDSRNLLFINKGNFEFEEQAEKFGLDDAGNTTQATFFDYDNDNDLDVYIINGPEKFESISNIYHFLEKPKDITHTSKLYKNEGGVFVDVTSESGIGYYNGEPFNSLNADLNGDGYQDLVISESQLPFDKIFINNGDGTFTEQAQNKLTHTSLWSMGFDMADFNNDGRTDIFFIDMAPEDHYRRKNNQIALDYDLLKLVEDNFGKQTMRNTLHIQNPDGTFSEQAELYGVARTDFSSGALAADFDNDGFIDIYISSGTKREFFDLTFNMLYFDDMDMVTSSHAKDDRLVKKLPTFIYKKYCFKNLNGKKFEEISEDWGLCSMPSTQGMALADLNNDGFVDIIVNNSDDYPYIFKNNGLEITDNNFVKVKLIGEKGNQFGIGTTIYSYINGNIQKREINITKGFQSSSEPHASFGIGNNTMVDSIIIDWPGNKRSRYYNISANSLLTANISEARHYKPITKPQNFLFEDVSKMYDITFQHKESDFSDFKRDRLIPNLYSRLGPDIITADFNNDNLEDFFITGTEITSSALYLQNEDNSFSLIDGPWTKEKIDFSAVSVFDINNDGYVDIYLGAGSNEYSLNSKALYDKVYINDGKGDFVESKNIIPSLPIVTSCVRPIDIDNDGDIDLFIGGRITPGRYPEPPSSYILLNEGGYFIDATDSICPELRNLGMVTDAQWYDFDGNGFKDLIIVGEWLPITIFSNNGTKLTQLYLDDLNKTNGWWRSIKPVDINNDGNIDFLLGNYGLNDILKPSKEEPVSVLWSDFDKDGSIDPIIMAYFNHIKAPVVDWMQFCQKMPIYFNKYLKPNIYAEATAEDLFTKKEMSTASEFFAYNFNNSILINNGDFSFDLKALPLFAQSAPINDFSFLDVNSDGLLDLIIGGNDYSNNFSQGPLSALGLGVFINKGDFEFTMLDSDKTGLSSNKEIKNMSLINVNGDKLLLVGTNNDSLQVYKYLGK